MATQLEGSPRLPKEDADWDLVSDPGALPSQIGEAALKDEAMSLYQIGAVPRVGYGDPGVDRALIKKVGLGVIVNLNGDAGPCSSPLDSDRSDEIEGNPFDADFGLHTAAMVPVKDSQNTKVINVQIGGFGKPDDRESTMSRHPLAGCNVFPPPSNKYYLLTTNGYAAVKTTEEGPSKPKPVLSGIGKQLYSIGKTWNAHTGVWTDLMCEVEAPSALDNQVHPLLGGESSAEQVSAVPATTNGATENYYCLTKHVNDYCRKCKQFHIRVGEFETLPERDTCGAYIPDWHQPDDPNKPWAAFKDLFAKLVLCWEQELGQDTTSGVPYDETLVYHPPHPKWKSTILPARGGFWKCRAYHSAWQAERLCMLCHSDMMFASMVDGPKSGLLLVLQWVQYMLKYSGVSDLSVGVIIVHAMGNAGIQKLIHYFHEHPWVPEDFDAFNTRYEGEAQVESFVMVSCDDSFAEQPPGEEPFSLPVRRRGSL